MTPRIVKIIAEIDEFKGYWSGMNGLTSNTLSSMRVLATIESIGSSTRIEGAKLSNRQVAALLDGLDVESFRSRDEQEVAGYARAMALCYQKQRPRTGWTTGPICLRGGIRGKSWACARQQYLSLCLR